MSETDYCQSKDRKLRMEEKEVLKRKENLEEKVNREVKMAARTIVFFSYLAVFVILLLIWMGLNYYGIWGEKMIYLVVTSLLTYLLLGVLVVLVSGKLVGKEKALKYYLSDLVSEKEWLQKMIHKYQEEEKELEESDPLDIEPCFGIDSLYKQMIHQAKLLEVQIKENNNRASLEILKKISSAHSGLDPKDGQTLSVPEEEDFLSRTKEEKLAKIQSLLEELKKSRLSLLTTAQGFKRVMITRTITKIDEAEASIKEIDAKTEIVRHRLAVC